MNSWEKMESRIEAQVQVVLQMLKFYEQRATFFVLGCVAKDHPGMVKQIKNEGHEIGSHGSYHTRLTRLTPEQFENELVESVSVLEKLTGDTVWGYRAPQFSVMEETAWAIEILGKHGFRYDSSIFPAKTPLYGVPRAPTHPYGLRANNITREDSSSSLLEFPLSVWKIPILGRNIPVAGGFYLRLFPYWFIARSIRKANSKGEPGVCYIHPWELDSRNPRLGELKWYHYYRVGSAEAKFRHLLTDFHFVSTRMWIEQCLKRTA